MSEPEGLTQHKVTVLLIDDQPIIGEAVRRMLAGESDVVFNYCKDASKALETALAVNPTVILQDLVMPDVDGLSLVTEFRANEKLKEIPMIVLSSKEDPAVKAEAFGIGANDYLVKWPDRLELLARIRYHSKGYINKLQRDEAYQALEASRQLLANDVAQARRYVSSLLPPPIGEGEVISDWRFLPSAELGGDAFGYHWLDDDHFAFYLLDVCGHGVGAALLSVSALNALRSQSLPNTDFRDPGQVLTALNRAFQMEQQNDMYFTIWYGVYNRGAQRIDYAGGGHPPALLIHQSENGGTKLEVLDSKGPMVGALPDLEYGLSTYKLERPSKVFVFSDGVYEIERVDGSMWPYREFVEFISKNTIEGEGAIDDLVSHTRELSGKEDYVDDFSMIELQFKPAG
jgi:phosphoserine phosphatase RsbU/P